MDQDPTRRAVVPEVPTPGRSGVSDDAAARTVMASLVARHGAPSLSHYRRTYAAAGLEWPGDEAIRARHPVAGEDTRTAPEASTRHSAA